MVYMGGKGALAKYILPVVLADRKPDQWYVEPFVGGFNMMDKVTGLRLGNDLNKYVIAIFLELLKGWEPPENVTEDQYNAVKANRDKYPDHIVGLFGFFTTYAGKWFGGFARSESRNYYKEGVRNIKRQLPALKGVVIRNETYQNLKLPPKAIIYCDPPYANTTAYRGGFDSVRFWDWARLKVTEGHSVFVSEYSAPDDFCCVWERATKVTLQRHGSKERTERLFIYKHRDLF